MVPTYALESFIGIVFPSSASVFGVLRECYEAFAIYSFFQFLVEYLGGKQELADTLRSKPETVHIFPFCCVAPWHMGAQFLKYTSAGILQYIPIKLLMSIITAVTTSLGIYGTTMALNTVNFWVVFTNNCSQIFAMYCLVLFYQGTKEELAPVNPVPKIISIKAIIFFTYWQQLSISTMVTLGWIDATSIHICNRQGECWSTEQISEGLVDFIICVEMLIFAVAHHYVFPVEDFASEEGPTEHQPLLKFMEAVNLYDVAKDVTQSHKTILTKKQELAMAWERSVSGSWEGRE